MHGGLATPPTEHRWPVPRPEVGCAAAMLVVGVTFGALAALNLVSWRETPGWGRAGRRFERGPAGTRSADRSTDPAGRDPRR